MITELQAKTVQSQIDSVNSMLPILKKMDIHVYNYMVGCVSSLSFALEKKDLRLAKEAMHAKSAAITRCGIFYGYEKTLALNLACEAKPFDISVFEKPKKDE